MYPIYFIPFIQMGLTFYISSQILLFLWTLTKIKINHKIILLICLSSLFFFFKFFSFDINERDLLVTFREFLCFALILASTYGFRKFDFSRLVIFFKFLIVIFFAVALIQIIGIHLLGEFITFPKEFFIANTATLEGVELAIEFETRLRPVIFFGEPSYAAFVLSIIYAVVKAENSNHIGQYDLLALGCVFILQSLSGIIIIGFLFLYFNRAHLFKTKYFLIFLPFILFISFYFLGSEVVERLSNFFSGNADESTAIRVIAPLDLVSRTFNNGFYLGAPSEYVNLYTLAFGNAVDNALFNLVINYGILSIPIFLILIHRIKSVFLILMLVLLMQFNGAYFSYDKAVLISLLLGSFNHYKAEYFVNEYK